MENKKYCFKKGNKECDIKIEDDDLIFIAMPFDKYHNLIYEFGIKKCIERLKVAIYRADKQFDNRDLFCKICEKIQQARYFIADISGYNPNVMIELGIAIGFGKKIMLLKEKDEDTNKRIISDLAGVEYFCYTSINDFLDFENEIGFYSILDTQIKKDYADEKEKLEIRPIEPSKIKDIFDAKVSKIKIKQGDSLYTTVEFEGKIIGGFFDNCIKDMCGQIVTWNWDRQTIPDISKTAQGILHGNIYAKSTWCWKTEKFSPGKYDIFVRVYEHPIKGERIRNRIKEKKIQVEII